MLTAADVMTTDLKTVFETDDLAVAWDLMEDGRFRHLPVVDEDGRLVGLLSHRDLARHALGGVEDLPMQEKHAVLAGQEVSSIMVRTPETGEPSEDLTDIAERLLENKFGCVPIVEGDRLAGLITESDFVRIFLEQES